MALADFKTLWDNKLKPAIPGIAGTADYATEETCAAAAAEINFAAAEEEEPESSTT